MNKKKESRKNKKEKKYRSNNNSKDKAKKINKKVNRKVLLIGKMEKNYSMMRQMIINKRKMSPISREKTRKRKLPKLNRL